jgi:hypothetical protein
VCRLFIHGLTGSELPVNVGELQANLGQVKPKLVKHTLSGAENSASLIMRT